MSDPTQPTSGEPSPHIEKLLEAANSASQTVAALHVAFMAFAAYLGIIVWGTTDEDLLRISPVKLPILDVELPLTTFYAFVPWLLVLLHFNLLIQLELLSRKLWNLDKDLPDTPVGQQIRDRLFIFPFTHMIAGRTSVRLIRWLLSLVVSITVIALPLFLLLMAQIRFLPYHDEPITWWQRGAVWADIVMLFFLWPLIVSPNDDMWERWRKLRFRLLGYSAYLYNWAIGGWNRLIRLLLHYRPRLNLTEIEARPVPQTERVSIGSIIFLPTLLLAFLFSIVAVIPGNMTVQTYYQSTKDSTEDKAHFEDWLIHKVPKSWLSVAYYENNEGSEESGKCISLAPTDDLKATDRILLGRACSSFNLDFFPRNLDLKEARLLPKEVSISLLTQAIDPDKSLRDKAFKEFEGLKLQGRDLRFADLSEALLPKADFRGVNLQGASLTGAKLQGANLSDAILQGAQMNGAQLQDANLSSTKLQRAKLNCTRIQDGGLSCTQLQGAILNKAELQSASLVGAQLQGAHLNGAQMQDVNLRSAELQGAELSCILLQGEGINGILGCTQLQEANFSKAVLKGADLTNAQMQGADLRGAVLQGVKFSGSNLQRAKLELVELQGADLSQTNLQGAFLTEAYLQGADLSPTLLQNADLGGAHLQGADLSSSQLQNAYLVEAQLQGADLSHAELQGANLSNAELQGADLSQTNLQGTELSDAHLQGINWGFANLDSVYMVRNTISDWSKKQQGELEAILKPLLNESKFIEFHERMMKAFKKQIPSGSSVSQLNCYSDNPRLLNCDYHLPAELDTYRIVGLHPYLIELACSDTAMAESIVLRSYFNLSDSINFGLATALLKALDTQKPCEGLAALTEQTRQKLREAAEYEKTR